MKRRSRWSLGVLQRLQRLATGRSSAPETAPASGRPWHMPSRIVLRFRDGSSVMLDPDSAAAIEMHRIADGWLTGR